jgi:hypothetical protein
MKAMRASILFSTIVIGLFAASSDSAAAAQKCPSDANRASQAVWAQGSISTGTTVTGTHPCGRRIQCTGGTRESKASRACRWL